MRRILSFALVMTLIVSTFGCASLTGTQKGAIIGGTSGALLGGVIGDAAGNTAVGAILGAAIGGAAGAAIGNYMDKQAEEMEQDLEGARIERIGEGIKITFESGILFDVAKADLRPVAKENLTNLGEILRRYEDTNILIEGHTDSDGAEQYNQDLSERRARAVSAYLAMQNVDSRRMTNMGYGELQPVADNTTVEGKQANRRVEVAVMANDDLKEAAKNNELRG